MGCGQPGYEYDYHVHTYYSACGKEDAVPAAVLQRAAECGLKAIGFADHCWSDADLALVERLRTELLAQGMDDWRTPAQGPVRYFVGMEAQMNAPDKPTISADAARELDFVLMATNHYHLEVVENPRECTPEAFAEHSLAMMEGAIALGYADVIAHPFTPLGQRPFTHRDIFEAMPEGRLLGCLDSAARNGVAVELNPGKLHAHYDFLSVFYRMCLDRGVRIALGSDSHSVTTLGYDAERTPPARLWRDLGITDAHLWHPRAAAGRT